MDSQRLTPPNIETLQQEVMELLREINHLVEQVSNNLSTDQAGEKYKLFSQEIALSTKKVEDLELRMAIVAPMKAGKSTIINVIVGQELLPSRNAAMTTIPTQIIFNNEQKDPTLNLTKEIITVFQEPLTEIKRQIDTIGIKAVQEKIAQYPHLKEFLVKIDGGLSIRARTYGRLAIIETLSYLNDLIRLYSILFPYRDPLAKLREIPSIETPFCHWQDNQQLGNLVIVDTPGPNEAGQNLRLTATVQEQLRKSSIVLIVLDFTQLNNKAAEEIKVQVQSVISLIGKENLYVLVNKIDQRRKGDLTPEQVKDFVYADLGLSKLTDRDRVFEVSAIQAFSATKFLLELQQRPGVALEEMETVETLAQEALGPRWERKLQHTSLLDLEEEANYLWEESGFKPFLAKAIKTLMENAAPRCIISSLNLCRKRLLELRDDLNLRNQAIAQDKERLKQEIEALEADLKRIELCRLRLKDVGQIRLGLQQNLNQILEVLKKEAKVSINDYFMVEEYERGDLLQKADIKMRGLFLKNLTSFEIFPEWISKNIKSTIEYKTSGIFEFDTEDKAEEFANHAMDWAKRRTDKLLARFQEETEKEIDKARDLLTGFLKKETTPIIERARKRIKETFNVELVLPPPSLDSHAEIAEVKPLVKIQSRYLDQGYEDRVIKKRAWYHWLWLVSFYDTERYKKPELKEDYYIVSLEDLVAYINYVIETKVNQINEELNNYLDRDFKEHINLFFAGLDNYIRNYRTSLKQAQQYQQLSLEEKRKLVANLGALVTKANIYLKQVDKYVDITIEIKKELRGRE